MQTRTREAVAGRSTRSEVGRTYLYYVCVAGAYHKRDICSARTHHKAAEQELRALQRRTEHLAQLERDRDSLLESYADLMPEAIDALGPEERRRAYRIIGLEVQLASDGSFKLSGDVMSFSRLGISSA